MMTNHLGQSQSSLIITTEVLRIAGGRAGG
jgi:hypothetical protein